MTQRRGFALMAALWLVVLVGATGYGLSVHARGARLTVANALESEQAVAAAEAALESGRAMLAAGALALMARPMDTTAMGVELFTLKAWDAGSRLQLNRATEADIRRLLAALGHDAALADRLAQRIADWRDADDLRRGRGGERDDYLRSGARLLPSNSDIASLGELRGVEGMTDEVLATLAPHVELMGTGQVNLNSAPREVLLSLPGFSPSAADAVIRRRVRGAVRSLDEVSQAVGSGAREALQEATPELSLRVVFETTEVVLEAEGWVDGSPIRVRARSVHQRSGDSWLTTSRKVER